MAVGSRGYGRVERWGEIKGGVMPQSAWMKRTLFAAFALLVIAAAVAGCGGGDSSTSSSATEESTEAAGGAAEEEEGGGGEEASGEGSVKIALLLPENETPRYET